MKINRLDHTKSLFPHFYDKTDESNFTKHLKVVGKPQYDIRHKLKTVEWSRIIEKPLQIWKEQTKAHVYSMHFKVLVPYLKQVNIYKNPVVDNDGEIIAYEELCYSEDYLYESNTRFFEKVLSGLESPNHKIPKDTFLLEVFTWDDYHFIKGFPENDYTVKEDNILDYRYNETFLSIKLEEISYVKYLTFRVHKDRIKEIAIYKNDALFIIHKFDYERIGSTKSTDFSYTYFDEDITNEDKYLRLNFDSYYEVEDNQDLDDDTNNIKVYYVDTGKDEYVFRLPLKNEDFDDNGVVKDIYDLEVRTFEKRYRCKKEYDKVYSKRYCGYDEQLNDCFDHDYSLDMVGRLFNVHRFRFYQTIDDSDEYLSRTYPSYNNRATEDDYHYMKRIQYYISNYNHIPFPVLEFWKYYHTMATIHSRKKIVSEMDNAYFRTMHDSSCLDSNGDLIYSIEELIDEEFESETVTEFSLNKATSPSGEASHINIDGTEWHEATIVNDVYVVPGVNYRLRYGIWNNYLGDAVAFDNTVGQLLNETYEGYAVRYLDKTESETYEQFVWTIPKGEFAYGDTFTLKFYAKGTPSTNKLKAFCWGNSGYVQSLPISHNGTYADSEFGQGVVWFRLTEDWKEYYVTWKLADEGNLNVNKKVAIRCTEGAELYVAGASLTKDSDSSSNYAVTLRMNCYNRESQLLRSTSIAETQVELESEGYSTDEDYYYTDTILSIPDDTASVQLLLESNKMFKYRDVTFERMTVMNFDNYYMGSDEDYNSNVFELSVNYEELPTNLRIGDDRFDILFKRSLPLTKKGFFYVNMSDEFATRSRNNVELVTSFQVFSSELLSGLQTSAEIGANNDYEETISQVASGECEYTLKYTVLCENMDSGGNGDISSILYYNACDNENTLSNYTRRSSSGSIVHEYSRDDHFYIHCGSNVNGVWSINNLTVGNKVKITCDWLVANNTTVTPRIILYDPLLQNGYSAQIDYYPNKISIHKHTLTTEGSSIASKSLTSTDQTWYTCEFIIDENNLTYNVYNSSGTLLKSITKTGTLDLADEGNIVAFALYSGDAYIRNLKVETWGNDPTVIYGSAMTSGDGKWTASGGGRTVTYHPYGCNVTGTANSDGFYKLNESLVSLPSEFTCEFDVVEATQGAYSESTDFVVGNISIRKQSNQLYVGYVNGTSSYTMTFPSTPFTVKVQYGTSTAEVFINGTSIGTWNTDYQYIGFKTYNNRSMTIRNFKIYGEIYEEDGIHPIVHEGDFVKTTVTYYSSNSTELDNEVLEEEVYSDSLARVTQHFIAPTNTSSIKLNISSDMSATLTDIQLIRDNELLDEEVMNGN